MFNPTANDLFDQDDLLQGAPEGAYRVTRSIIALIVRVGEGALATERAVGKVLHGKAHTVGSTHPNSPYGTRSKAASSSISNPSTPCRPNPRLRNAGARRVLACLPFDPTAQPTIALPLRREESGLLRGRRGTCLLLVHPGRPQRRVLCSQKSTILILMNCSTTLRRS